MFLRYCIAVLLLPCLLNAAEVHPTFTVPSSGEAPTLDGVLDDASWSKSWKGTLRALEPDMPIVPTTVYAAHGPQHLWLAFDCAEPTPDKIVANAKEDGGKVYNDDVVEIFLNPTTSTRQYLHLAVNSLAAKTERGVRDDGQNIYLRSGWRAAAKVHGARWIVEIAIPFAGLGVGQGTPSKWTVNFCRNRQAGGRRELSVWQGGFNAPTTWASMEIKGVDFARLEGADGGRLPSGNFLNGHSGWTLAGNAQVKDGQLLLAEGGSATVRFNPALGWQPVSVFPVTTRLVASGKSAELECRLDTNKGPLIQKTPITTNDATLTHDWAKDANGRCEIVSQTLTSLRGLVAISRAYFGGKGLDVPLPPIYESQLGDDLPARLRWLKTDRLRLFYGWPLGTTPRAPAEFKKIEPFLDRAAEGGFNAVIIGGGYTRAEDPWMAWIGMRQQIQAWKRGLHVFAHGGYIWSPEVAEYDPPAIRKLDRHGKTAREHPQIKDFFLISPLDMRPWETGMARAADVCAYAAELGLPDLLAGVHLDEEFNTHLQEYDYSDEAFGSYFAARGMRATIPPTTERFDWLVKQGKLDDFHQFQEEEVTRRIKKLGDGFYAKHPDTILFLYNYMKEEWADRAWAKALSTPRLPTILMDDQTYYTGYSGSPRRVPDGIEATRKLLGHEPMYVGSIIPVINPPYPMMNPERAAQETYLLVRSSHGGIIYTQRRGNEDMYETHLPYWPEWRKAFESLQREGAIQNVPVPARSGEELRRADAALAKLDAWAKENWFKTWTPQPRWRHVVYSDPPAVRSDSAGVVTLTKTLVGDSPGKEGPQTLPNHLSPGHSLSWSFPVPADLKAKDATLKLKTKPRFSEQTWLQLVVNGVRLPLQGPKIQNDVQVNVPGKLLKETNTIEVAYFCGDSIYNTVFDHWIELHELALSFR